MLEEPGLSPLGLCQTSAFGYMLSLFLAGYSAVEQADLLTVTEYMYTLGEGQWQIGYIHHLIVHLGKSHCTQNWAAP